MERTLVCTGFQNGGGPDTDRGLFLCGAVGDGAEATRMAEKETREVVLWMMSHTFSGTAWPSSCHPP